MVVQDIRGYVFERQWMGTLALLERDAAEARKRGVR